MNRVGFWPEVWGGGSGGGLLAGGGRQQGRRASGEREVGGASGEIRTWMDRADPCVGGGRWVVFFSF